MTYISAFHFGRRLGPERGGPHLDEDRSRPDLVPHHTINNLCLPQANISTLDFTPGTPLPSSFHWRPPSQKLTNRLLESPLTPPLLEENLEEALSGRVFTRIALCSLPLDPHRSPDFPIILFK